MIPPKEWPTKLILDKHETGQNDWIYYLTSLANRYPISIISPSVYSSLEELDKKIASGCISDKLFFKSLISQELP